MRIRIRRKAYGRREVLADIDIELAERQTLAVIGPSGCGKTTLLRIVAGLDRDFEGSVPPPERLSMIFQSPTLLPWRSALDNVALALGGPGAETRAAEALAAAGLAGHETHFPGALSMGQQRRVALARAFAVEPELLLMDEPYVSLDEAAAEQLRALTRALLDRSPVRAILVTHDLAEAVALADRAIVLGGTPSRVVLDRQVDRAPQARDGLIADLRAALRGGRT